MRHPLHSICPYFAMFPEGFVLEQLYAYTRPNDVVLDPFCGRGTTVRNVSTTLIQPGSELKLY